VAEAADGVAPVETEPAPDVPLAVGLGSPPRTTLGSPDGSMRSGSPPPTMTGEEYRQAMVEESKGSGLVFKDGMESVEALAPLLMAAGASVSDFKIAIDEDATADDGGADEDDDGDEDGTDAILDREALKTRARRIITGKDKHGKKKKGQK